RRASSCTCPPVPSTSPRLAYTTLFRSRPGKRPCEVGDFILPETDLRSRLKQFLIHRTGQVFIHVKLAGLQLRIQRRVLLIEDFVDRKSTRLNSSHGSISYAVFCLKKKN